MSRKLLQSVLCLLLCPLLAAQQVQAQAPQDDQLSAPPLAVTTFAQPAYTVGPDASIIRLEAAEGATFAKEKIGASFRFVVDHDVELGTVTMLRAGTPVTGTIIAVKRGSARKHRGGQLDLQLSDVVDGNQVVVRLMGASRVKRTVVRDAIGGIHVSINPGVVALIMGAIGILVLIGGDR
jgi:hypothetical protein